MSLFCHLYCYDVLLILTCCVWSIVPELTTCDLVVKLRYVSYHHLIDGYGTCLTMAL